MDTGLGSPRSSSGYGSSEEDRHSCTGSRRRRRKSLAQHCTASVAAGGTRRVGSPQTPQSLSPSDTGSSLSSPNPFSIDFRSVFDDSMPDFSDLTAFSEPYSVELPVDLMGTWSNEFDVSDIRSSTKPTAVDVGRSSAPKGGDKRPIRDDSHILVSLLKRPKAELDWITTGSEPAPDQFLNKSICDETLVAPSGMTLHVDHVTSASPLQRLKALTHSDVVNHAALPPSTKTPGVVGTAASLPAAVPVGVLRQPPDGRAVVERRQTSPQTVSPRSQVPATTSLLGSSGLSQVAARQRPGPVSVSLLRTDCPSRRRSSPAVRSSALPVAVRRVCLELDDHRYSTPVPPTVVSRPWLAQTSSIPAAKPPRSRRSSADGRCPPRRPSTKSRPTSSSSSSSVLEMLLRTSKQLRPNDGSDASVATCRGTAPVRRPSAQRRVESALSRNRADPTKTDSSPSHHGSLTFLLDSLLADRDGATLATDDGAAAATTSSTCVGELALPSSANDSFSLFSEHLLCDSQGVIDVGLLTDDQPLWTPSRLDDKVTMPTSLCLHYRRTFPVLGST